MQINTKETLFLIARKISLIPIIICTALIQNTANNFSGAGVFLLIPLSVSIAMFEHEFSGMLYGLFCGALWDLSSPVTDGIYTLYFTVFCCIAGLLTHYLLRNSFITASVLTFAGTLGFCLLNFIFNCLVKDSTNLYSTIKTFYIPSCILTVLTIPVFYFTVKYIETKLRKKTVI